MLNQAEVISALSEVEVTGFGRIAVRLKPVLGRFQSSSGFIEQVDKLSQARRETTVLPSGTPN